MRKTEKYVLAVKIFYAALIVAAGALGVLGTVNRRSDLKIVSDKNAIMLESYGYFTFCLLTIGSVALWCLLPKNKTNADDDTLSLIEIDNVANNKQISPSAAKKLMICLALLLLASGSTTALGAANKYGALNNMNKEVANFCVNMGASVFIFSMLMLVATCIKTCSLSKNRYVIRYEHDGYGSTTNTPGLTAPTLSNTSQENG